MPAKRRPVAFQSKNQYKRHKKRRLNFCLAILYPREDQRGSTEEPRLSISSSVSKINRLSHGVGYLPLRRWRNPPGRRSSAVVSDPAAAVARGVSFAHEVRHGATFHCEFSAWGDFRLQSRSP